MDGSEEDQKGSSERLEYIHRQSNDALGEGLVDEDSLFSSDGVDSNYGMDCLQVLVLVEGRAAFSIPKLAAIPTNLFYEDLSRVNCFKGL